MNQIQNCPICQSEGTVIYRDVEDKFFAHCGKWDYFKCFCCNCLWLDKFVNSKDVESSYAGYYTSKAPRTTLKKILFGKVKVLFFLMHRYFLSPLKIKNTIVSDLVFLTACEDGDTSLLDVGCGNGEFLKFVGKLGVHAYGLEPDAASRITAQEYSQRPIYETLSELGDLKFDKIVMNNVIEHVDDPVAFLSALKPYLKVEGQIVMRTPNVNSRLHEAFNECWRGLEPPRHLVIFSKESLIKTAFKSGFSTIRSYSHDKSAIYSLKHSLDARQEVTDKSIPLRKLYLVKIMSLFWFLSKLRDVNRGEEIFLVAKIDGKNGE